MSVCKMRKLKNFIKKIIPGGFLNLRRNIRSIFVRIETLERNQLSLLRERYGAESKSDLNSKEFKIYSQNGEDGVLEKIFEVLNITKGTFVNAGCDDIHDHSNVRRLISNYGWDGLFIEPNGDMLTRGRENLENDDRITDGEFEFHHGFLSVNEDDERKL